MEIKKLPYNNEANESLCYFEAIISGDMAGYILVEDNFPIKEYCYADYVFVEDRYTRKGVAASLYNEVERFLGKIMIPSGTLIGKNIRSFWRSRGTLFPELLENRTFSTKEIIDIITNTPQSLTNNPESINNPKGESCLPKKNKTILDRLNNT